MSSTIVYINPDLDLFDALNYMEQKKHNTMPVSYDKKIIGVITKKMILREILLLLQKKLD